VKGMIARSGITGPCTRTARIDTRER
jgi:hypothetical protein